MIRNNIAKFALCALSLIALFGCEAEKTSEKAKVQDESEVVTNRIAIPLVVRENLGISFINVERRRVSKTLRVPGNFEHKATALTEYHAPVAGRVELLVEQYDQVKQGQPLYRLDSPEWNELQQELTEAEQSGAFAGRRIAAGGERIEAIEQEIKVVNERIVQLEKLNAAAGGRASEMADARGRLAAAQTALAQAREDRAQTEAENIRLRAGSGGKSTNARFEQALGRAAMWTSLPEADLLAPIDSEGGRMPRWKSLDGIVVHAAKDGYLETVASTSGSWVTEGQAVVGAVDHRQLVFLGRGLQSDLGLLRDGQRALIVPPQGGSLDLQDSIEAELRIGLDADPHQRLIDLILEPKSLPEWARPGVAAFAEVVIDETAAEETAIPISCVITDGLDKIYFLRDRKDPDQAIRVVADLGVNDGRWVAVRTGLKAGDEVVLDGAYELKLTGAGKAQQGGHFHSDGTFHEAHD